MGISLLFGHKFMDHLFYVWVSSSSPNLLECMLNCSIFLHFSFHALLEKGSPCFLNKEICSLFYFILILTLICCHLSNISLTFRATEFLFEGLLFVDDWFLQWFYALLAFHIFIINVFHQLIEFELWLKLFLSSSHLCFVFLIINGFLWPQRFLQIINSQLKGYKVFFHSIKHVLVLTLEHVLILMHQIVFFELFCCFFYIQICSSEICRNFFLLLLRFLNVFLYSRK